MELIKQMFLSNGGNAGMNDSRGGVDDLLAVLMVVLPLVMLVIVLTLK